MNKFTQAVGLLERRLVKTARVLAVRAWEPATFVEVDLHMPDCDMGRWQETKHMKCRVAPLVYRDYTPSGWDEETHTCTLFIDTSHDGPGARWAKGLTMGDAVEYLGVASSHQQPEVDKRLIFLGDESAIGHFLAMQQLASASGRVAIKGAISIADRHHREEFEKYFSAMGFSAVEKDGEGGAEALEAWMSGLEGGQPGETVFYLAGHIPSVVRLRKVLRSRGFAGRQIRAEGFWS